MDPPVRGRASRAAVAVSVLVVAAALVALLAALDAGPFGGDSGDGEPTSEAFVATGDEICDQARDRFVELQQSPPRSATEAADLTESLIEISRAELDDMRSLNAPSELEEELSRYLDAREQGISIMERGLEAAREGDAQAYAQAQADVARGQVRRARLAREVGFTNCSRPLFPESG